MAFEAWQVPTWAIVGEARRRAGLSQAELAHRAGTSQPAVARYERARAVRSLATLYRLVRACGLHLGMRLEPYAGGPHGPLIGDALARSTEDRRPGNDAFGHAGRHIRDLPVDPEPARPGARASPATPGTAVESPHRQGLTDATQTQTPASAPVGGVS